MTRAPLTHEELQAAINTAARRMTTAAPSSDLRARVMTRIDAAPPRWGWRLAIAGGAIGAVALTSIVMWRASSATAVIAPAATQSASASQNVEPHPTAAPIVSSPLLSTPSVARTATERVIFTPSAEELAWRERAVQALEQPAALVVAPLEQPRLTIDPIDITPLSVAPLTVPGMGGASNK